MARQEVATIAATAAVMGASTAATIALLWRGIIGGAVATRAKEEEKEEEKAAEVVGIARGVDSACDCERERAKDLILSDTTSPTTQRAPLT